MSNITPTRLTYLDDPYQLELTATVRAVFQNEHGSNTIHLDQTVFYPQGGGQPYDLGTISSSYGAFEVQQVRFTPDGLVHHIGEFKSGAFGDGTIVKLNVDGDRRALHNRLHTAGHLVDVAMIEAGYDFEPSKGYHFPDSPYVEYKGLIPAEEREEAKAKLDAALTSLIADDTPVAWRTVQNKEDLKVDCKFIPDYLPEGKPIRVVTVSGLGCPCGGTHVLKNSDLGKVSIKRIKAKGGNTRISYLLEA